MASKRTLWRRRQRVVELGGRQFVSHGLDERVWEDFYHRALTISLPRFFGIAVLRLPAVQCAVRAALPDRAGRHRRRKPARPRGCVFFGVETLSTVGYGDMHPPPLYTHVVATAEIILAWATSRSSPG